MFIFNIQLDTLIVEFPVEFVLSFDSWVDFSNKDILKKLDRDHCLSNSSNSKDANFVESFWKTENDEGLEVIPRVGQPSVFVSTHLNWSAKSSNNSILVK